MQKINFKNLPDIENEFDVNNWVNLTLLNNFVPFSGQNVPQYRKVGKCVYLRGVIKTTQNVSIDTREIATIPYTPTTQYTNVYYPCVKVGSTKVAEQIQFTSTGSLLAPGSMTTSDWIPLDGIVIVLD